jgi:A-macroglobulin TED domain/Alpha-2-macroglobulin family/MG2 domain/Carboxypeptidase regulatory-like domain/A-macroglobulin receptor binding domain/Macroglobulin domain MG3/Alpha-2-macroglobulin bait region domain
MRHRLIGPLFFCLLSTAIFAAKFSANISTLHVNESATRFLLQKEGATVSLALENPLTVSMTARVTLDLIDPHDIIRSKAAIDTSIPAGPSFLKIPLFKAGTFDYDDRELIWYRLRYQVEPAGANGAVVESGTVSGVISLSEITPDFFRLQVSAPQEAGKGLKYAIRARTMHLLTGKPISGVKAQALMTYQEGDDERSLKASGVTDSAGEARLEFKLPNPLKAEEVDIKVSAEGNGFYQEAEEEVRIFYTNQILVSTDKPLYQPGQTLHIRVLGFDRDRKALAETDGTLKVRDPESGIIFRSAFKTSRFGVASVDWPIPDNARLGRYWIEVWLGEESPNNASGSSVFKISRYDLPNFVVNVKTDRSYYLPGQNADAEIRADYLFGQPVKKGRVRVVRETEREWNYREQKWETTEGDHYEGDLDGEGRFIARIKLEEEHEDFKPGSYMRFRDLRYAAYLTDQTTGRTEQRRFDLRITRDQIHVYLIQRGRAGEGMPLQFYISASYADGTPAQCEVAISRLFNDKAGDNKPADNSIRPKLTVKTNRYGVAKVAAFDVGRAERYGIVRLELSAQDGQGRSGRDVYDYSDYDSLSTSVETDRTLYRPGEPIKARVTSNSTHTNWIIDLRRGSRLLATRTAQMKDKRIEITFPFTSEFADDLTIIAYPTFSENDAYNLIGIARILYPRARELKLDIALNQASYRPGDEASLDLRVLTTGGRAAESALGMVVFDKAIEERARTDQEFGGRSFGFYQYFKDLLGDGENLAGVTRRDLDRIDLSKPLPEGLELVAEVLLNQRHYGYYPRIFSGSDFTTDGEEAFHTLVAEQIKPVDMALDSQYRQKSVYPVDETTWRRQLLLAGVELDWLRDPWNIPYRAEFSVEEAYDRFELVSAGPDKRFGTEDDFTALKKSWLYFRHISEAIERAVENYHVRTGAFIRDRETLRRELLLNGALDIDLLRDRWGGPYRFDFGIDERNFFIKAGSGGPNRKFEDMPDGSGRESDDFIVSSCYIDYTSEPAALIKRALSAHFKKKGTIPKNDGELREVLKRSGIDFDGMRDGWDHGYYAVFKATFHYSSRVTIFDQAQYGEKPKSKTEITPVTQQLAHVTVRSAGADGKEGTADDFDVVEFSQVIAEESAEDLADKSVAKTKPKAISYPWNGGAIAGTVQDPSGAVVANTTVTAKHIKSESVWTAKTNDNGGYLLSNLAPGIYEVRFEVLGFKVTVITGVAVHSAKLTKLDAMLDVASMSETVVVSAGPPTVMMTSSAVASVSDRPIARIPGTGRPAQLSTPRLREYFPETLFWQPQLETDKQGRAQLRFKLADNITTWKLSVVGSTVDGEIGIAEREFTAFQPFFAEHDPPKVLTEGDEISLPVVLRNYLERSQSVNAQMKPESWFELLSPGRKQIEVKAGDAGNVIFDFRAVSSVKDGKQRITVFGSDASDAIVSDALEKPVGVHPDGEEIAAIASAVFADNGVLEIVVPEAAIKDSVRAELKIYSNLMAHALEGIEAILQRPYGCAEQTISSTYPNVMVLRYLEPQGERLSAPMRKVAEKARNYARKGYEKLLGYRSENGGVAYWRGGDADEALTAYALRFLIDARDFIEVDEDVIEGARKFLIGQQQTDGRWIADFWGGEEDAKRASLNTAFIARVLALEGKRSAGDKTPSAAVSRALDYLAKRIEEIDEPYLIASYALAAIDAGEAGGADRAVAKLRALAREEAGTTYWHLETNTPFYGWGLAGRIETTALAVKALKRAEALDGKRAGERRESAALTDRGLLFLLRNKDRYGVWLSTQATINVLDTLISLNEAETLKSGPSGKAEIFVNGKRAGSVVVQPSGQLANPLTMDISPFLNRGQNRVEIRRARDAARASAQIVETHYEPWGQGVAERRENVELRNSSALRLSVNHDRVGAKVGEEITCTVAAERVGHRGYGMMLAEIGLPPGADVDRESLEQAVKGSGRGINHYDVLPDRVIFYLWPPAGGVKFDFRFRPRYGIKAKTAPSVLYDYYNPEARAVVAPAQFVVK